ncbi:MAG: hypothetical protein FJW98_07290 [Actinobacteria bacterium]|nr:hypothetical protein [Actinomycetota bacterium]
MSSSQVRAIVIAHVVATWFMVGLIWTIHVVHYPLFAEVGDATYVAFQSAHVDRIGKLLFVPWLTEGITLLALLWLAFIAGRRELRTPVMIGAIAMAMVLVLSGFWSAPAHGELMDGFDTAVHDRLMTANLIRTLAWTVRGLTAVWILSLVWPRTRELRPTTSAS